MNSMEWKLKELLPVKHLLLCQSRSYYKSLQCEDENYQQTNYTVHLLTPKTFVVLITDCLLLTALSNSSMKHLFTSSLVGLHPQRSRREVKSENLGYV